MAGRFRGDEFGKMDDKGRIVIPAPFRRVLAEHAAGPQVEVVFVFGPHLKDHAVAYTAKGFEQIEERAQAMAPGQARTFFKRSVVGRSKTLVVDESGRIVLPAGVRARCGLPETLPKGETVPIAMSGEVDTFTLWRRDLFDAETETAEDLAAKLPEHFDIMQLLDDPDAVAWD